MTQQQLPGDATPASPSMELLDGDATAATGPSLMLKLARGTIYGVILLAATALLAISAVPELAELASFIPEKSTPACSAANMTSCTTLDQVSFDEPASSCCAAKAAMASVDAGGCCPLSSAASDESLVATGEGGSCCATLSRASLLASESDGAGCCPLSGSEEPIDAASLLAVAPEEPADEQGEEEGAELEPDENEVEE